MGEDLHIHKQIRSLYESLCGYIFGQEDLITEALVTFLAHGHILITGAPGLAKTSLVRVFASHFGLQFGRIQFTPDLLPSDITGSDVLNFDKDSQHRSFSFIKGPIFANLVLADEINRASPRTQSAMLEAMQEGQVTVSGKNHQLPHPFMVFATQNPFESEGTFPLPEAQLDRFFMHSLVSYPKDESELKVYQEHANNRLLSQKENKVPVAMLNQAEVQEILAKVKKVQISNEILTAIQQIIGATRPENALCPENMKAGILYGAGPRGGLSLISASQALAFLEGDECVTWKHIKRLVKPVLRHRIRLNTHAMRDFQMSVDLWIDKLLVTFEERNKLLTQSL